MSKKVHRPELRLYRAEYTHVVYFIETKEQEDDNMLQFCAADAVKCSLIENSIPDSTIRRIQSMDEVEPEWVAAIPWWYEDGHRCDGDATIDELRSRLWDGTGKLL